MNFLYTIMVASTTLILLSLALFLIVFLGYLLYEFIRGWL